MEVDEEVEPEGLGPFGLVGSPGLTGVPGSSGSVSNGSEPAGQVIVSVEIQFGSKASAGVIGAPKPEAAGLFAIGDDGKLVWKLFHWL